MKKTVTMTDSIPPLGEIISIVSNGTVSNGAVCNEQTITAPTEDVFDRFSRGYLHRENVLLMVSQLNQLIKCVQKHRGISMSMLAGGEFVEEFEILQRQLENRLSTIEAFAKKMDGVFTFKDKENLKRAWITIRQDWQGDNLNDNFELHSHFIEQLLTIVFGLSQKLEPSLIDGLANNEEGILTRDGALNDSVIANYEIPFSAARRFKQVEILRFVGKKLPELIEGLAKVRGLASYASVVGSSCSLDDRKLRYLVSSCRDMSLRVIAQAERLEESLSAEISTLKVFKTVELKHICLLNIIEQDVLSGRAIVADAHQLFNLATEIIDAYWSVIDDGFAVVRRWHMDDLDAWCELS